MEHWGKQLDKYIENKTKATIDSLSLLSQSRWTSASVPPHIGIAITIMSARQQAMEIINDNPTDDGYSRAVELIDQVLGHK